MLSVETISSSRRRRILPELNGIGVDSRFVTPGMLYVAVRGSQADGHRYIADAVRRGAAAVVVEQPQSSGVPEVIVRDGRRAALSLGAAWYDYPARRLTLLGVTGTNGKTTTRPPQASLQRARTRRQHRHVGRVRRKRATRLFRRRDHSPHRARSIFRRRWPSWWREARPTSRWRRRRTASTRGDSTVWSSRPGCSRT